MKEKLKKEGVPFTQIANAVLNDQNLSWKAKGLFAYLYSKPEDWAFSGIRIALDSKDGKDGTYTGIKELEDAGYLVRGKTPSGRVEYCIFWSINPVNKPVRENPKQGKSLIGKIPNISNKDLIQTKNNTNIDGSLSASPSELSYSPVSQPKPGCPQTHWKNKKRVATGKKPTFAANDLLGKIRYFKELAMEIHGQDFSTLNQPSGKMLKGFKSVSKYADLKEIINWWFEGGGEYADYTPDAFISESTVNKFKAKSKKSKLDWSC